jgi:lipoprotein-anchoring transpeptidase ErfK/SrfK
LQINERPGYEPAVEDSPPLAHLRQLVFFRTPEPAGTIIISTPERMLYVVLGNSRALRYGIGVGRECFQWQGLAKVSRKAEWPDWTLPPEMIARRPDLPRNMPGGAGNPNGARVIYLDKTVFRIHGTNQPEAIGHAVSSGCFRLINADVIHLYQRVQVGARVVVRQAPEM